MRYFMSGLVEDLDYLGNPILVPAIIKQHPEITAFACPDCLCTADVLGNPINMATGGYVLVGLKDSEAVLVEDSGYVEAQPIEPEHPAVLDGEA